MKNFLRRIKLLDDLTVELDISKNDFVSSFRKEVDEGTTDGIFSNSFDIFSSSKNVYKGHVGYEDFKISKKRKLFASNMISAVASGKYNELRNRLVISTEINRFKGIMIPFYILTIVFYSIFLTSFLMADSIGGNAAEFAIPFIFIHAAFMLGLPCIMMRNSVKKSKHELEREFHFIAF